MECRGLDFEVVRDGRTRRQSNTHLLVAQVEELVQVDSTVRVLPERPLLLSGGIDLSFIDVVNGLLVSL